MPGVAAPDQGSMWAVSLISMAMEVELLPTVEIR